MARSVVVDAGFFVALLSRRDSNHRWAVAQAERHLPPWNTCEAVLSEAFHLLGPGSAPAFAALLRRGAVLLSFDLGDHLERVLRLMQKYSSVPMSLADACLVRMTEILTDPIVVTTDSDFRVYRRHSRQTVPASPSGENLLEEARRPFAVPSLEAVVFESPRRSTALISGSAGSSLRSSGDRGHQRLRPPAVAPRRAATA